MRGGRGWVRRNHKKPASRRLLVESLEPRELLTTVSVSVGQPAKVGDGEQPGYLTFTRDLTNGSLPVTYSVDQSASTAVYGTDYTLKIGGSSASPNDTLNFDSGQSTTTLEVDPVENPAVTGDKTLIVTIEENPNYFDIGTGTTTLVIQSDAPPPPAVVSAIPNLTTIADANVGTATLEVQITYNEAMDTNTDPTVSFSPDVQGRLRRGGRERDPAGGRAERNAGRDAGHRRQRWHGGVCPSDRVRSNDDHRLHQLHPHDRLHAGRV